MHYSFTDYRYHHTPTLLDAVPTTLLDVAPTTLLDVGLAQKSQATTFGALFLATLLRATRQLEFQPRGWLTAGVGKHLLQLFGAAVVDASPGLLRCELKPTGTPD